MLRINLLPEEQRKRQKTADSMHLKKLDITKIPVRSIIITSAAFFIGFQIIAGATLFLKTSSNNRLTKQIAALEADYKAALSLKSDVGQLGNKLSAINELTSKSILWSKKMADLSTAVTEGVWLSGLTLIDQKGPNKQQAMLLKGSVISQPAGEEAAKIANLINSLKSHKGFFEDFEDIKLESSQIRKIANLDVMDFNIVCYFKKGRSYFDKYKKR